MKKHVSSTISSTRRGLLNWSWLAVLLAAAVACSMPGFGRQSTPAPTTEPTRAIDASGASRVTPLPPTPTPQPQPPALVEAYPAPGEEVPLNGAITLYFNQPMEQASVEEALQVSPPVTGTLAWPDPATLVISPSVPLLPEQEILVNVDKSAQSQDGRQLYQEVNLNFRAAGYLRVSQALPSPDAAGVDPSSAVVAAFNRPIVPLGAEAETLPVPITLDPPANGSGEWLNTSTYVFYPEPGLQGGATYRVVVDPNLKGVDGNPLQDAAGWTFSTTLPQVETVSPLPGEETVRLDAAITMTFNIPMDPESVQAGFALLAPGGGPVPGQFTWTEDRRAFGFRPDALMTRASTYQVRLDGSAQAGGGTALGNAYESTFTTVQPLAVIATYPFSGGQKDAYSNPSFTFNGPILSPGYEKYLTFTPRVPNSGAYWDEVERMLYVYGNFDPEVAYALRLSPDLPDPWGGSLGQEFVLNFTSGPLPPQLIFPVLSDVFFLTASDSSMVVQALNMSGLTLSGGSVSMQDFIAMISSSDSYQLRQTYRPADEQSWSEGFALAPNRMTPVEIPVAADRQPRSPGLYVLRPNLPQEMGYTGSYLLVVSNVQVTFKVGAADALVWAVDIATGQPVVDSDVTLYGPDGSVMGSGRTDAEGVFRTSIPVMKNMYDIYYAVTGLPGQANFGMAISTWNQGMNPWEMGIPVDYTGPHLKAYLYTDRPVYRPGQTVYFRGIVRQAYNGRYQMPDLGSLPLSVYRDYSQEVASFDLPISAFGTINGAYTLPENAPPGYYRLGSSNPDYFSIALDFQVAEYRKPEIDLQVAFDQEQALAGDALRASVNARYFFDAPAGNVHLRWALYAADTFFDLPGYRVGVEETRWLDPYNFPRGFGGLGGVVQEGEAFTDPQGLLTLELPSEVKENRQQYTLEVTAVDEAGLPVSARAGISVNPASIYIGVRSDAWVGRSGELLGFDVLAAGWQQNPAGVHALRAEFQKVDYVRDAPIPGNYYITPGYTPVYTPVGSTDFQTSDQGKARISFTPPEPGTYQLTLSGEGAQTQINLWVGGEGDAAWPNLPNQRLYLGADKAAYLPGETANVFVPNPYGASVPALVTLERGAILSHRVVTLDPGGSTLQVPLTIEEAPNAYLAVLLLGTDETGLPGYRAGYLNLSVSPAEFELNVTLTSQPERAAPGDNVLFDVLVTDSAGQPVQGEFSLAVVDRAALALADPNAPDIFPAFYSEQSLSIRTGLALAAYARREFLGAGGVGGGGGDGMGTPVIRESFPDTAVWMADIVTGADGRASVSAALPDNLTTWDVLVRGVAADTRVGQARADVVVTKDLLVRPVTPRFLVAGDHALLAAVVQNNTAAFLQVDVSLQTSGFVLDDAGLQTQSVPVEAGGRARVEWWGTAAGDVASTDLVFSAFASDGGVTYQDASRPAQGALPVLRYVSPQSFRTAGIMDEGGEWLELVSLPRSYEASGGSLQVEMASSLAGAALTALDSLDLDESTCTEQVTSRFLPYLEIYQVFADAGISNPDLQARMDRALQNGLIALQARQLPDGGWSWCAGRESSDPFITAYVLFGLSRARQAGAGVNDLTMQNAVNYLSANLFVPDMGYQGWQLDRLAFMHFALQQAGAASQPGLDALYEERARLSPWGQALLAAALEGAAPGSPTAAALLSDLSASAIRSATGAHWEEQQASGQNMSTPTSTTAMVVYALAQNQAASPLAADAVRYLVAQRNPGGGWSSTYATSWGLLALARVMQSTGELEGGFAYSASLNGAPLLNGQAGAAAPLSVQTPSSGLYPDHPNALLLQREDGPGRLYYTAGLTVNRPVDAAPPLRRGISVERAYYAAGDLQFASPLAAAFPGDRVKVRLTISLENEAYYLSVEDFIPAGTELLDVSLKTSQIGMPFEEAPAPLYDPARPFAGGWGSWLFSSPTVFDDHIAWTADYLPAGTYQLTYTLVTLQPGAYRVLPARAWQTYFPEVQGASAGTVFAVKPR